MIPQKKRVILQVILKTMATIFTIQSCDSLMPSFGVSYWVDNFDPVMVHLYGNWGLRYYGLAYFLAFLLGYYLLKLAHKAGRSPLDEEKLQSAMLGLISGVLAGGRVGYIILYDWRAFLHNPIILFEVWDGGMSSHGGFAGVMLALIWISRKWKIPFFLLGDLLCPVVPVGLFLGRVANFINGELWGKISYVHWAVIFPLSAPPGTPVQLISPRHPSQLYEAFLEGLVLLSYAQWRFWRTKAHKTPGRLSGEFLVFYALVRLMGELFREPDAGLIWGMSRGSFYSLFLIIAGFSIVCGSYRRNSHQRL